MSGSCPPAGRTVRRALDASLAIAVLGCASAPQPAPIDLPPSPAAIVTGPAADAAPPSPTMPRAPASDGAMRLGPDDLLQITVLEDPELNQAVRVDAAGRISIPLLGEVAAAGLTPRELEEQLEQLLRRRYIRDPHVGVQVTEMQGRAVSVLGAVARPGVFQIRESRPLLELIALAGGLAPNAGDRVLVARAGLLDGADGEPAARTVSLRALLESENPRDAVMVQPGDLVRVVPAGLVYVVGEVRRPGAFPLAGGEGGTVLRAIASAEGLAPNAAGGRARIIRTGRGGERAELPVDLGAVIGGRAADVALQADDVIFVPGNRAKAVTLGVVDALVRMVTLRGVF